MKLTIAILITVLVTTCNPKNRDASASVQQFIYQATTRGSSYSCDLTENEMIITSEGRETFKKSVNVETYQWQELISSIKDVSFEGISQLKVPSSDRDSDRARIATLTIITQKKTYRSTDFDEGNPPRDLVPLINRILALAQTVD